MYLNGSLAAAPDRSGALPFLMERIRPDEEGQPGPDLEPAPYLDALGQDYDCAAAHASRNCFLITFPLALRGSGSVVSAIVSGTL